MKGFDEGSRKQMEKVRRGKRWAEAKERKEVGRGEGVK
jgi:hypothetical protein